MDTQTKINEILDTGITQEALAPKLGCSQSMISALKNGKRGKRPSYELGLRIESMHAKLVKAAKKRLARQAASVPSAE